jgi:hypothetical protein
MFTRDDMEEAYTSVRLSFQALMMGAGTSPLELLKASTIKAIKSADNGGPKEKHFLYVMKGLNKEGTYNDGDGGYVSRRKKFQEVCDANVFTCICIRACIWVSVSLSLCLSASLLILTLPPSFSLPPPPSYTDPRHSIHHQLL